MAKKTTGVQRPLTAAMEVFAQALAQGGSQADAYRKAYPGAARWKAKSVQENACKLAALPEVKARIRELLNAGAARAEMTVADVLLEAMRLARFDIRRLYNADGSPKPIHELDDDTAAAIQAVDIHEEYIGTGKARKFVGYTKRYRVADKNTALEKLFRHFGLYEKDNNQNANPLRELAAALSGKVIGAVAETPAGPGPVLGVGAADLDDED